MLLTQQLNSSFPAKGIGIFDRPQRSGEPEPRKSLAIICDYPSGSVPDPKGPDKGEYRMLRGGSWDGLAGGLRSSYRYKDGPDFRYGNGFGFDYSGQGGG